MKNVHSLLTEEINKVQVLDDLFIGEIVTQVRFIKGSSSYGKCRMIEDNTYQILLNEDFCKIAPEIEIRAVLMHEILHTLDGSSGHDEVWKNGIKRVLSVYSYDGYEDYHLCPSPYSRTRREYKHTLIPKNEKYFVSCPKCKRKWGYQRKAKVVKHPEWYRCVKCNCKLVRE